MKYQKLIERDIFNKATANKPRLGFTNINFFNIKSVSLQMSPSLNDSPNPNIEHVSRILNILFRIIFVLIQWCGRRCNGGVTGDRLSGRSSAKWERKLCTISGDSSGDIIRTKGWSETRKSSRWSEGGEIMVEVMGKRRREEEEKASIGGSFCNIGNNSGSWERSHACQWNRFRRSQLWVFEDTTLLNPTPYRDNGRSQDGKLSEFYKRFLSWLFLFLFLFFLLGWSISWGPKQNLVQLLYVNEIWPSHRINMVLSYYFAP